MNLLHLSRTGVIFLFASLACLLSACDKDGAQGPGSIPNVITGVVSAPGADSAQFVSAIDIFDPIKSLAAAFSPPVNADVTGFVPINGATVQLVRLNSQGQVSSVIATTTSSGGGTYVFTDTPAPDSTLAVRVTGQSSVMRAIVTGSEINVSPTSEAVVDSLVSSLNGNVPLGNFAIEEVAALTNLVAGLDVDLSGKTFAQAVAAIKDVSSPILNNLILGFAASGVETMLYNGLYGGMQFEPVVDDTFTLGPGKGGIEIRTFVGGWGYDNSGLITGGNIFGTITHHNLSTVEAPASSVFSEGGIWTVVTASGQVVAMNPAGSTTLGAVTSDGTLMAFPVETRATGTLGRGLMLAVRKTVGSTTETPLLDNTILDAASGGGTTYNLVRLQETFSGLLSNLGQNLVAVTTQVGTLTFDSSDTITYPDSEEDEYAALTGGVTSARRLALDLDNDTVAATTPDAVTLGGRYLIAPDGGVIMKNSDATFLAQGYVTGDGNVIALASNTDLVQIDLNVLANDTDPDVGDTLTIDSVSAPALGGMVTISASGKQLLYTPPNNVSSGTEHFTYTVSDGTTLQPGTVDFTLTTTNTAPDANPDNFSVAVSSSSNLLNVLANDTDVNIGQNLTITEASVTTKIGGGGTVSIDSTGRRLVYTPPSGVSGSEVLTYKISDGIDTDTATATVMIVLGSTGNTAPTAVDDSGLKVAMNSTNNILEVLSNDSDPDAGDALTITAVGTPAHGTVSIQHAGPGDFLSYTPASNYSGTDTFSYTVSDGEATASAAVSLTVAGIGNTTPVAVADSNINILSGSSGTNNTIDVLANDHDDDVGDTFTITQVSAASNGGTVSNGGNNVSYTPPSPVYTGSDSFTYTISDGTATATAAVTLNVVASNTAPNAVDDGDGTGSYHVAENSSNNALVVLANDSDADIPAQTLTITAASVTTPLGAGGAVTVNGTGDRLLYTPPAGESGTEVLSYTISDGALTDTATVTVTVVPYNTAPVANDDSGINVAADSSGNALAVLTNDSDADIPAQTLTITAASVTTPLGAGGTVTINGTHDGLIYTPLAGQSGTEVLSYTVSDGIAADTATVTVTVGGNLAPSGADDAYNVAVDSSNNALAVLANDSDADIPAQPLTITAASVTTPLGAGGTVTINGTNTGLNYTPLAGQSGTEVLSYTVSDGNGGTDTATVTVSVGTNLAPTGGNDAYNVAKDSSDNALAVLTNDSDADIPTQPLTITAASVTTPLGAGGTVTINGTSNGLIYTPLAGQSGTEVLSYTVSDGAGGTDTATVTVSVGAPINDPPVAVNDDNTSNTTGFTVALGSSNNSLNVLANDRDPDVGDALTITAASVTTPLSAGGTVTINAGHNRLIYTPAAGASGTEVLSYTVSDGKATDTAAVAVTVLGVVNTAPDAVADPSSGTYYIHPDTSNNAIDALANDHDADVGDVLTITQVGVPAHGVAAINGTHDGLLYSPTAGYTGFDSFTYTISDGKATATATVALSVTATNHAPIANPDNSYRVLSGSSGNEFDVLANDSDSDVGDVLTIVDVGYSTTSGTSQRGGLVTIIGGGTKIAYTPPANYVGSDAVTYIVSDGTNQATGTVNLTVIAGNTPPVAVDDDGYHVAASSSNNALNVLANDSDVDVGDTLTITAASVTTPLGAGGTVAVNGTHDGLIYTPPAGQNGTEVLSYTVSDGTSTTAASVTVTVGGSNAAPTVTSDTGRSYVVPTAAGYATNLANREIGLAIRQGSGLSNSIVRGGTYNVVEHAGYFTGGAQAAAMIEYKSGTLSFGLNAFSGELMGKRASLDIGAAKSGATAALSSTESAVETISSGTYSVAANGTMTLSFVVGDSTVFGEGAVSPDGQVIAVVVHITENSADAGRGLIILARQPD